MEGFDALFDKINGIDVNKMMDNLKPNLGLKNSFIEFYDDDVIINKNHISYIRTTNKKDILTSFKLSLTLTGSMPEPDCNITLFSTPNILAVLGP